MGDVTRHAQLHSLRTVLGSAFDSGLIAQFLYVHARMGDARTIVELGRGFGLTALHLAAALRENGGGTVWTVDDEKTLAERFDLATVMRGLADQKIVSSADLSVREAVEEIATRLGVADNLVQVTSALRLEGSELLDVDDLPTTGIDLLFSDFHHSPEAITRVLGWALTRMATCSSIVFDSASTWWPSWLYLERLSAMLSQGRVPALLENLGYDIADSVIGRQFTLVPLTVTGRTRQNGAAWLKISPIDVVPWPRTGMRSPDRAILGW